VLINLGVIADGVLVNAIGAVSRMVARPPMSRRAAAEMSIARWLDTEKLTRDGLPGARLELAGLAGEDATELQAVLSTDEVQGALSILLAARLTDARGPEAAQARQAVRLAISSARIRASPVAARYAEQLSEFYDDKISVLVAHLEGAVGQARLRQIRNEAYNSRIVALLGAIERQTAALADHGRDGKAEEEFLGHYRRQVRERHGRLEPPDFERRRKVPVEKIYVNTSIREHLERRAVEPSLNVMDLAGLVDRTVLLGDPGGGKTTAANVLANFFASESTRRVPFLVTLRDYAAKESPERSVAGHIEHTLETLYQCPAPGGLVERLLLTGRAIVIFDGLDELLDTSRRCEVSERVEQCCSAYPLTRVLVTSRLVGYDQARLDDTQFTCYRLGGFGDKEVAEYVRKWFAVQEDAKPAEAEAKAFLEESASAPDLRSNPLLLSLMCILYRGAGSLPRDRAGIYARCADLLFDKWDERRKIHRELRAGHLVEPAIRYLAWWLFSGNDPQAAVTERQLIDEAAKFLHGRGFESEGEARSAATEFVAFCRDRMWVFSDAGTTADGEKLYAFTHRTFLEYFAAAQLVAVCDSPEDLANSLAPHVASEEWQVVGELAIQIKDRGSDRGADRVYRALLDLGLASGDRYNLLTFLAACLPSAKPSPAMVRNLTRAALDWHFAADDPWLGNSPLWALLGNSDDYSNQIAEELSDRVHAMIASADHASHADALLLVLEIGHSARNAPLPELLEWSAMQAARYAADIAAEAARNAELRTAALRQGAITMEQALAMPGGFAALMDSFSTRAAAGSESYTLWLWEVLATGNASAGTVADLAAIGRYLLADPALPWVRSPRWARLARLARHTAQPLRGITESMGSPPDEFAVLGAAAVICVCCEVDTDPNGYLTLGSPGTDPASVLGRYIIRRSTPGHDELPDLPVPTQFRQLFRDWAQRRVNFVEIREE
jgi:hypothetical protein